MKTTVLDRKTAALSSDTPAAAAPTRNELLTMIAAHFAGMPKVTFGGLYGIETYTETKLRATAIDPDNNVYAQMNQVVNDAGIPTDGTMGGLMDATGLGHGDIHSIGCHCIGDEITGDMAADRIRNLIEPTAD